MSGMWLVHIGEGKAGAGLFWCPLVGIVKSTDSLTVVLYIHFANLGLKIKINIQIQF